jgi:lipopolysaccharide export system protein LptA
MMETITRVRRPAAGGLCALAVVILGSVASARQARVAEPAAKPAAQAEKPASRPWHITFDELVHNDATGEGEATRVVATSDEDTVVKADLFAWNDKKKTARATGHLSMTDEQADGTADQVDIEYMKAKRLMVLTGNVRLTLKPRKKTVAKDGAETPGGGQTASGSETKPETSDIREYPIEVTCDRVEYEYARSKRHAVLTGRLRATQKLKDYTRTLTAERAEWFGPDEKVVLTGPVRVEDTKGRKGESPEDVIVYTREGQEAIKLRKGTYTMPIEDEDRPQQGQPPKVIPPSEGAKRTPPK